MRRLVALIIVATPAVLQADILYLCDGTCHYGVLVAQDEQQVVFRVMLGADGASGVVRSFPTALVTRVAQTGRVDQPPAALPAATPSAAPEEDYAQMIREGFELLDDGDTASALRALQRAVQRAPDEQRTALDTLCRAQRGVALDELLAQTRFTLARRESGAAAFRIDYATPLERAALARLLVAYQDELLATTHDGRSVAAWADEPTAYDTLRDDARRLARDASRAAAVIGARLHYDAALRRDLKSRNSLQRRQRDLTRLAAHVMALPGYTSLGVEVDDRWDEWPLPAGSTLEPTPPHAGPRASSSPPGEAGTPYPPEDQKP